MKLVLSDKNTVYCVNISEIVFAKSDNTYTTFYFTNKESFLVSKPINSFEEIPNFLRIRQDLIINIMHNFFIEKLTYGKQRLNISGYKVEISDRTKSKILKDIRQKFKLKDSN